MLPLNMLRVFSERYAHVHMNIINYFKVHLSNVIYINDVIVLLYFKSMLIFK